MELLMFFRVAAFVLLLSGQLQAEPHWAVGCWDCRSWGAIRLFNDNYAIDVDPEGDLNDLGCWQNFSPDSVIIIWTESRRIEIIQKDTGKFLHQTLFGYSSAYSPITEVKRSRVED
jgi:hypothetical protein